jgi:uncharacterized protein
VIQRETPVARAPRPSDPVVGPVRTCVGCRKRELAVELLRLAVVGDASGTIAVTVDTAGNLPGRGAWLHPNQKCLQEAIRRRAFVRALRITGMPDTTAVVEWFEALPGPGSSEHSATEQVAKIDEHTVKSR